jgi:WD40 repeat protein
MTKPPMPGEEWSDEDRQPQSPAARGRGRPPKDDKQKRKEVWRIPVTAAEKERIDNAAKLDAGGARTATWARDVLLAASDRVASNKSKRDFLTRADAYFAHDSIVRAMAWSPTELVLATATKDQKLRLLRLKEQDPSMASPRTNKQGQGPPMAFAVDTEIGADSAINALAWSRNGEFLAFGADDNIITVLNRATKQKSLLEAHKAPVETLAWTSDDTHELLASGSRDNAILLWDPIRQSRFVTNGKNHEGSVMSCAWGPAGTPHQRLLASAGLDSLCKIWTLSRDKKGSYTLSCKDEDEIAADRAITCLSWSPDGTFLAMGSEDGTVRIAHMGGEWEEPLILRRHERPVNAVYFAPKGLLLASKSHDGSVCLWRPSSMGAERWEVADVLAERSSESDAVDVAFREDGPVLYLATLDDRDTAVRLWEVSSEVFER